MRAEAIQMETKMKSEKRKKYDAKYREKQKAKKQKGE